MASPSFGRSIPRSASVHPEAAPAQRPDAMPVTGTFSEISATACCGLDPDATLRAPQGKRRPPRPTQGRIETAMAPQEALARPLLTTVVGSYPQPDWLIDRY